AAGRVGAPRPRAGGAGRRLLGGRVHRARLAGAHQAARGADAGTGHGMSIDPLVQALAEADPVAAERAAPPPRGRLPRGWPRGWIAAAAVVALVVALWPSSTPGGGHVLERAFAEPGGSEILHWRVRVTQASLGEWTDDLWMHVRAGGVVDAVRER